MKASWLDKSISWIAPSYALKRHAAHMMMDALSDDKHNGKRNFDAITASRLRGDWTSVSSDADATNITSLAGLRNRIRALRRNSGIVSGPIKRIANNVIGSGIRPQARVKEDSDFEKSIYRPELQITKETAEKFNYNAEKLWRQWVERADAYMQQTFYEQQSLAFGTMYGDGEVLAICRSSQNYKERGRIVPLTIEVIEIDRLYNSVSELNNPKIRNGIEFDEEGVPIRYNILKQHPGANIISKYTPTDAEKVDTFGSNGMRKVFHLFDLLRPGQTRGYTPFAAGLKEIQDLDRYFEAEVVGARVAACLAAFVKSPGAYEGLSGLDTNTNSEPIMQFQPGMIERLGVDEDIIINQAIRPNPQFSPFVERLYRNIANALDIPYEVFANDWGNLNYSNARTVLLQAYLAFRVYQKYIIDHFCKHTWENFISDCIALGLLEAPGFTIRRQDYLRHVWIPPGWQWVDPLKESEAARSDLDANINTLADILSGKGDDWEEVMEQRAIELKKQKELEEKYGIKFGKQEKPGGIANGL